MVMAMEEKEERRDRTEVAFDVSSPRVDRNPRRKLAFPRDRDASSEIGSRGGEGRAESVARKRCFARKCDDPASSSAGYAEVATAADAPRPAHRSSAIEGLASQGGEGAAPQASEADGAVARSRHGVAKAYGRRAGALPTPQGPPSVSVLKSEGAVVNGLDTDRSTSAPSPTSGAISLSCSDCIFEDDSHGGGRGILAAEESFGRPIGNEQSFSRQISAESARGCESSRSASVSAPQHPRPRFARKHVVVESGCKDGGVSMASRGEDAADSSNIEADVGAARAPSLAAQSLPRAAGKAREKDVSERLEKSSAQPSKSKVPPWHPFQDTSEDGAHNKRNIFSEEQSFDRKVSGESGVGGQRLPAVQGLPPTVKKAWQENVEDKRRINLDPLGSSLDIWDDPFRSFDRQISNGSSRSEAVKTLRLPQASFAFKQAMSHEYKEVAGAGDSTNQAEKDGDEDTWGDQPSLAQGLSPAVKKAWQEVVGNESDKKRSSGETSSTPGSFALTSFWDRLDASSSFADEQPFDRQISNASARSNGFDRQISNASARSNGFDRQISNVSARSNGFDRQISNASARSNGSNGSMSVKTPRLLKASLAHRHARVHAGKHAATWFAGEEDATDVFGQEADDPWEGQPSPATRKFDHPSPKASADPAPSVLPLDLPLNRDISNVSNCSGSSRCKSLNASRPVHPGFAPKRPLLRMQDLSPAAETTCEEPVELGPGKDHATLVQLPTSRAPVKKVFSGTFEDRAPDRGETLALTQSFDRQDSDEPTCTGGDSSKSAKAMQLPNTTFPPRAASIGRARAIAARP